MWEAIAANRRRSILLIGSMGLVLVTLGACVGMYYVAPFFQMGASDRGIEAVVTGGLSGAGFAGIVWLILWLTAVSKGDKFLLRSANAQRIHKHDDPRLWNVVEEMTIASGLSSLPDVYLIEDHVPNAFAVGRIPEKAAVAVTSGLLRLFNRDELQGVVAHEIAHVKNLDIRFMTLAAVLAGSVEAISRGFFTALLGRGAVGARVGRAAIPICCCWFSLSRSSRRSLSGFFISPARVKESIWRMLPPPGSPDFPRGSPPVLKRSRSTVPAPAQN